MPEENMSVNLEKVLDELEDKTFNTPKSWRLHYKMVQNALDNGSVTSITTIERLLSFCIHNIIEDKKHSTDILMIISLIVKRVESGELAAPPNLLSSALAIINVMKTIALLNKIESFQILCLETLVSYPADVLISITTQWNELFEMFDLYCHQIIVPFTVRIKLCDILHKLLTILPADEKAVFVKNFVTILFKVIPIIVDSVVKNISSSTSIETLEMMTNELKNVEYSENCQWLIQFEAIYNPEKYPAVMKNLLDNGNPNWDRLWVAFIKLLKNQITRSNSNISSPINSLLPVVESAFKMDVANRCRAFRCWEALIDNFLPETNEVYLSKRLKLLLIPLHSNNAKYDEIAIAKFGTWYHLIVQLQNKIDKFMEQVIISFLHFCFGKNIVTPKVVFVPGLLSNETKTLSVQAFVEIAGHLDCNGCGTLRKINTRIINTNHLVTYWNQFSHCIEVAIMIVANDNLKVTLELVICLWKSFVLIIAELPANNIRRDIFNELLAILKKVIQVPDENDFSLSKLWGIIFVLVNSLFHNKDNDNDDKVRALLTTKSPMNVNEGPIYKILEIILHPTSKFLYNFNVQESVERLKPLTNLIMDKTFVSTNDLMEWTLKNVCPNDHNLMVWAALAERVHENKSNLSDSNLHKLLIWPVYSVNKFSEVSTVRTVALIWYKLYSSVYLDIKNTENYDAILTTSNITDKNKYFLLSIALAMVKYNLIHTNANISICEKEIGLIMKIVHTIENYKGIDKELPMLGDVLVFFIESVDGRTSSCEMLAKDIITIIIKVFKLVIPELDVYQHLFVFIKSLLSSVKKLLNGNMSYLNSSLVDELVECLNLIIKHSILKSNALPMLNKCLQYTKLSSTSDVNNAIKQDDDISNDVNKDKNNFTTPKPKSSKKKETKIVNTVVENGEEYVVVKSNWKFNPRKLTENQKEKLQRKREDIPALYQDLSQSQDEFKLTTWKTDSQDTSTTNSKSSNTNNTEEVSLILKNIPSSDVVPKIFENIFSDKKDSEKERNDNNSSNKSKPLATTVKDAKSPRIALKDRVFRNVRNLIEKSSVPKESKELSESMIQIENVPKTPVSKDNVNNTHVTNSAPPKINIERPSRVKRKPKKFDDSELFMDIKKGRRLSNQNDSPPDMQASETPIVSESNKETKIIQNNTVVSNDSDDKLNENRVNINEVPLIEANKTIPSSDNHEKKSSENKSNELSHKTELDTDVNIEVDVDKVTLVDQSVNENIEIINEQKSTADIPAKDDEKTVVTPKVTKKKLTQDSAKKNSVKKSRIEKELAIDMVEGHPFLKTQSERRLTRKNLNNTTSSGRRKSLTEKLNKSKLDMKSNTKIDKKVKDKDKLSTQSTCSSISSQDETKSSSSIDDLLCSEDIIESSQDSTITTISSKSTKQTIKKLSVLIEPVIDLNVKNISVSETQNSPEKSICDNLVHTFTIQESKDDTELSINKTALDTTKEIDLTENMDTEPTSKEESQEIILIKDDDEQPNVVDMDSVGPETQELADADTLPTDPNDFPQVLENIGIKSNSKTNLNCTENNQLTHEESQCVGSIDHNSISQVLSEPNDVLKENKLKDGVSSPLKDEVQRKKDFLDNTLEISPIKTMSPVRHKKSPSPETSNDYVVIKLTSPVQSNGEPFEKCDSPEIFTDDKISPDKRDQSPPRQETTVNNTSPSSTLSLKKNKPQVRTGGRAAQMLGLCVPGGADRLQTIRDLERSDIEESKKCSPSSNTQARRNLRILYNSVNDNNENTEENEDSENFLKLKRSLPTLDSSPSGPILKRKLADIADDATVSPASKRKRVSFHDPPVSTTISVQKYIEPGGIRSPQNSAFKRQERQSRSQTIIKSPKRLDNVFKLDSVLTKAVESFNDADQSMNTDDTQVISLDETPTVEIIKISDLNNTDPICPELIDCTDSIELIATDLSSPTMKSVFLKELEDKIKTIGDLAKMTELEVNRLCIKAPKVAIARKVLSDYAVKKTVECKDLEIEHQDLITISNKELVADLKPSNTGVEINQIVKSDVEMQTDAISVRYIDTQTEKVPVADTSVQTKESDSQSTKELIATCLSERPDFVVNLGIQLDDSSKQRIADRLPFDNLTDTLMKQVTDTNAHLLLSKILEKTPETNTGNKELFFLQNYLCDKFSTGDIILFCSKLLQNIHDK